MNFAHSTKNIKEPNILLLIAVVLVLCLNGCGKINSSSMTVERNDVDSEYENIALVKDFGEVPHWIAGTLLRIGPAKYNLGKEKIAHWFDGLGMTFKFDIDNKGCSYSNRYLRSTPYHIYLVCLVLYPRGLTAFHTINTII